MNEELSSVEVPVTLAVEAETVSSSKEEVVGAKIRGFRKASKLSQVELAGKVGISQPLLSLIERGKSATKQALLENIASVVGVSVDDINA